MRTIVLLTLMSLSFPPVSAQAQASRHWITETTVTVGRGGPFAPSDDFIAGVVVLGDLGVRWSNPSGIGWGFSAASGYDLPNEAFLLGVRARITREWDRGRLEGSLGVLASSAGNNGSWGGMVGLAFYPGPWTWGAVVAQFDLLPTYPNAGFGVGDLIPTRDPAVSVGLRIGERPGLFSWSGAAVVGLLALILKDVDFGCC